ncbi:c-type cytochrome [Kordiimonas aquimaris]|uniref:c-type cytochrome n=1 Tax=Kordiimonas aquimaris TaxID=707591 RepID=UPI0021D2EECA|nr:cytochrome c [Kordiimonas aquimaris]
MIKFLFNRRNPNSSPHVPTSAIFNRMMLTSILTLGLMNLSAITHADDLSDVEKAGKYLVAAGNCVSCHTSENGSPFAGGLAFETPFGTIYSTNISSDPELGIGGWSLEEFEAALRHGERPDGENLYPVFPYTSYTLISDEDVASIYAFLKTVEPVKYTPPENDLGFPYNQRWAVGLWKALYFDEGRFEPEQAQTKQWNRGAYLVEGLGHCGMCHSPRNFMGAIDTDLAMTGGTYMTHVESKLSAWSAPNLTSADNGLSMWHEEDIKNYLKLGVSARAGVFGPMNKVVMNSTRHMSAEDVTAMAVYLKSLPANSQDTNPPAADTTIQAGSVQYDIHCGTCHLPTGQGSPNTGPTLIGSPVVLDTDPSSLINITLFGAQTPKIAPSDEWNSRRWQHMNPFAAKLNDKQVADLLSFIRSSWGHKAGAVSSEQVTTQRK